MRLLHPETLRIVATVCKDSDFENATVSRKQIISHAWSEVLKYKATNQTHPKMFIHDSLTLGAYMHIVYKYGRVLGCKLDFHKLKEHGLMYDGFCNVGTPDVRRCFDSNYLFSDAVSLYLKGVNIFPYIYGDEWQKYCPIISLKEVKRIVDKTLSKKKEGTQ